MKGLVQNPREVECAVFQFWVALTYMGYSMVVTWMSDIWITNKDGDL